MGWGVFAMLIQFAIRITPPPFPLSQPLWNNYQLYVIILDSAPGLYVFAISKQF